MLGLRTTFSLALTASLAFAGGCGEDSISRDDLPDALASAVCDQVVRCPGAGLEGAFIRILVEASPSGTCEDAFGSNLDIIPNYDAQIAAGTIRYDGVAAQKCIDAFRATCSGFQALSADPSCSRVYRGTIAVGSACQIDDECVEGAYCDQASPDACGGLCQLEAALGEPCGGSDPECGASPTAGTLDCRTTTANSSPHCVLTRYDDADAGQPCGWVDGDGDEQMFSGCSRGLYCKKSSQLDSAGVCAAPIADLQACEPFNDVCAGTAVCMFNGGTSRCQQVVVQNEANTQCGDAGPFCNPLLRLECASGICQEVGNGTVNAACRDDYPTDCNEGLYCNTTGASTGVCATKLGNANACDAEEPESGCASSYCDDSGVTPICADRPVCF